MYNIDQILRLLENSGFQRVTSDGVYIFMEDPTCFVRSLEGFVNIAWIAITAFAGILLFGWGISLIRGAKNDLKSVAVNIRNLFLIFGILALSRPIANAIWGGDVFALGCNTIQVPVAKVNELIATSKLTLKMRNENDLYEDFDIYDTAVSGETMGPESYTGITGAVGINMPEMPIESTGIISYGNATGATGTTPLPSEISGSAGRAVISANGKSVTYYDAYGNVLGTKIEGSASWRNNNPGNMTCSSGKGLYLGAIACNGRFLVFANEEAGMDAHVARLKQSRYQNAWHKECPDLPKGSLGSAICVWAPPSDNNSTRSYMNAVSSRTGIPLHTQMSSLNDSQLRSIAKVQKEREGWTVGRTQ
ncbi:MAG: hypothetical protein FWE50_00680 [Alphaproteobacteria bacterium]|nr:hypothetical protein [Alphaproteobacteria bacterium]